MFCCFWLCQVNIKAFTATKKRRKDGSLDNKTDCCNLRVRSCFRPDSAFIHCPYRWNSLNSYHYSLLRLFLFGSLSFYAFYLKRYTCTFTDLSIVTARRIWYELSYHIFFLLLFTFCWKFFYIYNIKYIRHKSIRSVLFSFYCTCPSICKRIRE